MRAYNAASHGAPLTPCSASENQTPRVVRQEIAPGDATRAEQSRASSPRLPAVAYCRGTPLRNEIEATDAGKLESATDHVASAIADRHACGAAKIQAHVVMALV
jgi:hypothetical protein